MPAIPPKYPDIQWYAVFLVDGKPVTKKREHYPDPKEKAYAEKVYFTYFHYYGREICHDDQMAIFIEWHRGNNKDGSAPKSRMDGDNILKSVKDALSGEAYDDDKQIKFEVCNQVRCEYKKDYIIVWLGVRE